MMLSLVLVNMLMKMICHVGLCVVMVTMVIKGRCFHRLVG